MQIQETLKNAIIVLDKDEDFIPKNLESVFAKIEKYKKLPFHDVILKIDKKNSMKFFEVFQKKKMNSVETEIKNDMILFKF